MSDQPGRVLIVEESRWRRAWPWMALAVVSPYLLIGPFLPVFALWGGCGLAIWILQSRRRKAALYVDGDEIVVVNPYVTYRVPRHGTSLEVGDRLLGPAMDRQVLAENVTGDVGSKALFLRHQQQEKIVVSVALGLSQAEFERVVTELRAHLQES